MSRVCLKLGPPVVSVTGKRWIEMEDKLKRHFRGTGKGVPEVIRSHVDIQAGTIKVTAWAGRPFEFLAFLALIHNIVMPLIYIFCTNSMGYSLFSLAGYPSKPYSMSLNQL